MGILTNVREKVTKGVQNLETKIKAVPQSLNTSVNNSVRTAQKIDTAVGLASKFLAPATNKISSSLNKNAPEIKKGYDFAKELLVTAPARTASSGALSLNQIFGGGSQTIQPGKGMLPTAEKFLFGNNKIQSVQQMNKDITQKIEKRTGIDPKYSTPVVTGGLLAVGASNINPLAGLEKNAAKETISNLIDKKAYKGLKTLSANIDTKDGERIGDMVIEFAKSLQKKGSGTKLVKEIEDVFKAKGVEKINIKTPKNALGFWEKQGYRVIGKAEDNLVPMTKKLGSAFDEALGITSRAEPELPRIPNTSETVPLAEIAAYDQELTGNLPEDFTNKFKIWVNARRATDLEGQVARKNFEKTDQAIKDGFDTSIYDVQEGASDPYSQSVREYFDTKYKQLKEVGIDLGFKENYLPQLWENSDAQIKNAFGTRFINKPSFSLDSIIKDYKEGISKGLTPRFNSVADLVGWYESYANKAIADKQFFTELLRDNYILPKSKAPNDWVTLDPDRFKTYLAQFGDDSKYMGVYAAPKDVSEAVNNYLGQGSRVLSNVARSIGTAKQRLLTGGIPNTGWNAHGLNILRVNATAENNPVSGFIRGVTYLTSPETANKYIKENLEKATFFAKHGLTLKTEDSAFTKLEPIFEGSEYQKFANKLGRGWENYFGKPLFEKAIPALKIHYTDQIYQDLVKKMPQKDAAEQASKVANTLFGGLNYDEMLRNKDGQNLLRSIILAPDWAESRIRSAGGIIKGITNPNDPAFKAYRTFARNMVLFYVTENIANKIMSGHWSFENDPGHEFEIDSGTFTSDGQKRFLRTAGTAMDFNRVPFDIAMGLAKGDLAPTFKAIANRLSGPVSASVHLAGNQDFLGRPIYGKNQFGEQIPTTVQVGNIARELGTMVGVPSPARAAVDVATDRMSPEQGLAQALELPIRYKGGAYSERQKQTVEKLKARGDSGEKIYDFLKTPEYKPSPNATELAGITKLKADAGVDSDIRRKDAEKIYETIKDKTFPAQAAEARKYLNKDRKMYDTLMGIIEKDRYKRTDVEQAIVSLAVADGTRARYIVEQRDKLPMNQRAKYIQDLVRKKVITKEVMGQITRMGAQR